VEEDGVQEKKKEKKNYLNNHKKPLKKCSSLCSSLLSLESVSVQCVSTGYSLGSDAKMEKNPFWVLDVKMDE